MQEKTRVKITSSITALFNFVYRTLKTSSIIQLRLSQNKSSFTGLGARSYIESFRVPQATMPLPPPNNRCTQSVIAVAI